MPVPDFSPGEVLTAAAMDSIGLWLVKSQAVGTGVSSVTVTDAFSADYDAYKILWNNGVASTGINLGLRLGGTTANYYGASAYGSFGSFTPFGYSDNNAALFTLIGGGDASVIQLNVDLQNPFLALATAIGAPWQNQSAAGYYTGRLADSNSYTAFTLIPNTGTMTGGTISVYGYKR
jgi:hypothetical protein